MGRILAIDYGTKRIGLALSDESKKIAFAQAHVLAAEAGKLIDLIKEKQVEEIILGLPLNLKGLETKSAGAARKFGMWLEQETGLPVRYIDERFTTKEILRTNRSKKVRHLVDSLVAQKMLERHLRKT